MSTVTTTLAARGLRLAARDAVTVTRRNLKHFVRQRRLLIFSTIQPVMFVVLFAFVFGGAIGMALPGGISYVDFLLPGIFVQSTAFRTTQTAVGLAEDLERGVIDRFRSMPMSRSAVLLGRTLADVVRSVLVIGLMIGVGYLIGFDFKAGVVPALGSVAIVALFGFALSWIFVWVALLVRSAEAAQSAGFVAVFPLVFVSSVFVPTDSMPPWLQTVADASPVTFTADAARALALGGETTGSLLLAIAWSVALLAVFVPLSVGAYRRIE